MNKIYIKYNDNGELDDITIRNDVDRTFYKKLNNIQIQQLKEQIEKEALKFILKSIENYSKSSGEICCVAIEHFYDGEAIDIGLRI